MAQAMQEIDQSSATYSLEINRLILIIVIVVTMIIITEMNNK